MNADDGVPRSGETRRKDALGTVSLLWLSFDEQGIVLTPVGGTGNGARVIDAQNGIGALHIVAAMDARETRFGKKIAQGFVIVAELVAVEERAWSRAGAGVGHEILEPRVVLLAPPPGLAAPGVK